ncbi:MAG: nickel-dependent hydrogenase large subunit [Propionibacteriaceae bacterium]|nr:nickel-dependent hydrogenase large subunit [Propionibacteriaceae bacterium]
MIQHIDVHQIIDAAPARVVVTRDTTGAVQEASFDLSGLPRVDALLTGRPVVEVPGLVERLCSICPAAHHLAGMRALESLVGHSQMTPTAEAVRRLLHLGSVISIHVVGLIMTHPAEALVLRRFAKAAMAAAGSPGHFPVTGVPGGVAAPADPAQRDLCAQMVADALEAARRVAAACMSAPVPEDHFTGADVALVDDQGNLDLFGQLLRAVSADGTPLIPGARAEQWDELVVEAVPGAPAPKPYLKALGASSGAYRVGPVAQLRIGPVTTPVAQDLQTVWLAGAGGASSARAIVMVHAVEAIAALLEAPELVDGQTGHPWPESLPEAVGVGWVDGARGLLVHRYATTDDGRVRVATILTPTAQNEPWLADLLRTAVEDSSGDTMRAGVEDAIREADPCLPCSSAPAGTMDLEVDTVSIDTSLKGL